MSHEEVLSAWRLSDRHSPIQLKTWLEDIRDILTRAIKGTENELERIRQIESSFSKIEALFPVVERLAAIRGGMEECLNVLRDQNRELDSRIILIEDLGRISADWEDSDELLDGFLIELKTCLENVRDMLTRAINSAGNELERIRQIESSFSKIEALSPVVERLTAIRGGMEECLKVLQDHNGELDNSVRWAKNLARTSAAQEAPPEVIVREDRPEIRDEVPCKPLVSDFGVETFSDEEEARIDKRETMSSMAWEVPPDVKGREDRLETKDEVPFKPLVSDLGVETFPDEEEARIDKRESIISTLSKIFSEHPFLILFSFVLTTALITASVTYFMSNQSSQLAELHKSISMLNNELSKSYSVNEELTLKNAGLNKYMSDSETRSRELKDKNNELKLELQATNSNLAQSKNDLDVMQTTNLRANSEIKAKLLEIANMRTELEGLRHLSEFLKAESGGSLILDPVWLKSGESAQILEGRLTIRLEQATSQDSCSDVIAQLSPSLPGVVPLREMNQYSKTLCPRLGIPENFRLKNNRCSILLLGSKTNNDGTKAYLVAVFKK